jgi:hypothetical protein
MLSNVVTTALEPVAVQAGKTTIQRNSRDSNVVAPDFPSYRTLLRKVGEALEGKDQFYIDKVSLRSVTTTSIIEKLIVINRSRNYPFFF